jgi:hypothetical protein
MCEGAGDITALLCLLWEVHRTTGLTHSHFLLILYHHYRPLIPFTVGTTIFFCVPYVTVLRLGPFLHCRDVQVHPEPGSRTIRLTRFLLLFQVNGRLMINTFRTLTINQ